MLGASKCDNIGYLSFSIKDARKSGDSPSWHAGLCQLCALLAYFSSLRQSNGTRKNPDVTDSEASLAVFSSDSFRSTLTLNVGATILRADVPEEIKRRKRGEL